MFSHRLCLLWAALLAASGLRAQSTLPAAGTAIPAQTLLPGGAPVTLDLRNHFSLSGVSGTIVQFDTVMGKVNVELRSDAAPRHVTNFLAYVTSGAYANSFFHRSASMDGGAISIVQGGGYRSTGGSNVEEVTRLAPVALEYNLPNARGTLAAARTSDINSATNQWYFNVRDNTSFLGASNGGGYSVFGRVIGNGMTVIDAIAALQVVNAGSPFSELPVRNFSGGNLAAANLIIVNAVSQASVYPGGSGPAVLAFTATSSNASVVAPTVSGSTLSLTPGAAGTASITVTATDTHGSTAAQTVAVTVANATGPAIPVITTQPQRQVRLASGSSQTVVFTIAATATPAPSYQWRLNGNPLANQRSPVCVLNITSESQAGRYTCVVTNSEGSVESQPGEVSFAATAAADLGRLTNLSIRTNAGTGSQTLIVGFTLGGAGTRGSTPLLVRGMGPSLAQFGLTGALVDPVATMFRGSETVATNDNWGGASAISDRAAQVGAFAFAAPTSLDAALAIAPADGSYTVQITERNNRTGVALAEIYDAVAATAFTATTPRLVNVSARTEVGTGGDILIAGFTIRPSTAKTVLMRAVGPTLAAFGVTETLADPKLQLFAGSTLVAENDNWGGDVGLTTVSRSVGAFELSGATSRDAVLLVTLPPGSYTAQVSGTTGGTGVALVELYEIP